MNTNENFIENMQGIKVLSFFEEQDFLDDLHINGNPEDYIEVAKGAQNLRNIKIPMSQSREYYQAIRNFISNCHDNVKITNNVGLVGNAKKEEFFRGEEIIDEILSGIDNNWSAKQKLAYVHYKMGDVISYIPDFNFEGININSTSANDSRNIWKSLAYGQSVCNGVTYIQITILARLGIKARELSSGSHSFLLTETEEGNIITDATWDLSSSLYKARPNYFGRTYEELRAEDGEISNAHKLEEKPENVIGISEEELREIYHSIGLTNEDRTFPLPLLERVEELKTQNFSSDGERLDAFFTMFTQEFSKEASHLSETRSMLEQCMLELGIDRETITTKFVYAKQDENTKTPYLILHINSDNLRDNVRFFDVSKMEFQTIDLRDLDENYIPHQYDTSEAFWKRFMQKGEMEKETERQEEEKEEI